MVTKFESLAAQFSCLNRFSLDSFVNIIENLPICKATQSRSDLFRYLAKGLANYSVTNWQGLAGSKEIAFSEEVLPSDKPTPEAMRYHHFTLEAVSLSASTCLAGNYFSKLLYPWST